MRNKDEFVAALNRRWFGIHVTVEDECITIRLSSILDDEMHGKVLGSVFMLYFKIVDSAMAPNVVFTTDGNVEIIFA